jgi:glycosyltransferase involved in cell wall biosynthesis
MISVVIPMFNSAEFIGDAINSVLAQTFTEWELIVVDDGSSDEGASIVRRYRDPRINLIQQPNSGVSAARNRGILSARNELVALLDADDLWMPDHLSTIEALARRFPQAVLCCAPNVRFMPSGEKYITKQNPMRLSAEDGFSIIHDVGSEAAQYDLPFGSSSVMLRNSALKRVGGFSPGIHNGEDWLLFLHLSCLGPVAYSSRRTVYYRERSITDGRVRRPQIPDRVAQSLWALRQEFPTHEIGISRFSALWHRMRGMSYLELNERLACIGELWTAVRLEGVTAKDIIWLCALALPGELRARLLSTYRLRKRAASRV